MSDISNRYEKKRLLIYPFCFTSYHFTLNNCIWWQFKKIYHLSTKALIQGIKYLLPHDWFSLRLPKFFNNHLIFNGGQACHSINWSWFISITLGELWLLNNFCSFPSVKYNIWMVEYLQPLKLCFETCVLRSPKKISSLQWGLTNQVLVQDSDSQTPLEVDYKKSKPLLSH